MILTVCLNPAVDITYVLDELVPGATHRVTAASERTGGKGVNAAHVATALGEPATVCGLLGQSDPTLWDEVPAQWTRVAGPVRRSVAVVDRRHATVFNETGFAVDDADWMRFVHDFTDLAGDAAVIVLSGSAPPGIPRTAYRELATIARSLGGEVIVDAAGALLRHSLEAEPTIAKPNWHEAAEVFGDDPVTALLAAGAQSAIVSRGPDGVLAGRGERHWSVRSSRPVAGNPTGAGDALAAALAVGLVRGTPWPELLRDAVATATAAVTAAVAGEVDAAAVTEQRVDICVEES